MSGPKLVASSHPPAPAGVVYDPSDFADPGLDKPTKLTVAPDGRVFGHLGAWKSLHIAQRDRVNPPKSPTNYHYFHQSAVDTTEGPLDVGLLTLGTGHADLSLNASAANEHYDNTGTQVAVVRAGEDRHGIWLSGRLLPDLPPSRVDELRRSGVSGDWRDPQDNGQLDLVAALAVNVRGFPMPVSMAASAAHPHALVAAGAIMPSPVRKPRPTRVELENMIASAAKTAQDAWDRREEIRARNRQVTEQAAAVEQRNALVAGAARVRDRMAEVRVSTARRRMALVAAGFGDTPKQTPGAGNMPPELRKYWTKGAGLAKWSTNPHPYTALVTALRAEIPDMPDAKLKGLAANIFKDVKGEFPGQRDDDKGGKKPLTAAASMAVAAARGA